MSWPQKILITYDNFTADLPDLNNDNKTDKCSASCNCKCKCCHGFYEKYVAFDGETVFGSKFSNVLAGAEDVHKMIRFRSSDMLLLLRTAQARDNFWNNQYYKVNLHEDYQVILDVFEAKNQKIQVEKLAAIMDTMSTGYRRAVSQLKGQEAHGALRPKKAAMRLAGLRCDCYSCENLPWKKIHNVEDHQKIHNYSDNFHCEICYRRFYLQHSLTSYTSRKIGGNTFTSEQLKENTRYKKLLENQKSKEKKDLQLPPAKVEGIVVHVPKYLKLSFKEETKPPVQKRKTSKLTNCPLCHQTYKYSFSHQLHMLKHRNPKDKSDPKLFFPCSYCDRSFLTRKFLKKHQKSIRIASYVQNRRFKCPKCSWIFHLSTTLQSHIAKKHKRKKKCLICKNPSLDRCCDAHSLKECRDAIKKHRDKLRLMRGPPKGVYKKKPKPFCEICKREFTNKFFFRDHLNKKHLKRKNFTCEICGANFYSRATMQFHRKSVHFLIYTVKCEVCDLSIKSKANYLRHCKSQSHKDMLIKLGKDKEKSQEDNKNSTETSQITSQSLDMETSTDNSTLTECKSAKESDDGKQTQVKKASSIHRKVHFCEPCGNAIVGNMQRHYRSTKHKHNLIKYNNSNESQTNVLKK
ncbi:zinc finger protein 728 [Drosophila eugracilis]|uniref:zinc finger protein 728 n=1 Tax=Drosophila eugracilis TaxID=29029 RepID=UPI0007E66332|nr:zinc finger protein 728 [Drosophila eugracilis]